MNFLKNYLKTLGLLLLCCSIMLGIVFLLGSLPLYANIPLVVIVILIGAYIITKADEKYEKRFKEK